MSECFEFDRRGDFDLEAAVAQAIGRASVCWTETTSGTFDSSTAIEICNALLAEIEAQTKSTPNLGCATTDQLLDELRARIDADYYAGGGGLDYSTVNGRPEMVL